MPFRSFDQRVLRAAVTAHGIDFAQLPHYVSACTGVMSHVGPYTPSLERITRRVPEVTSWEKTWERIWRGSWDATIQRIDADRRHFFQTWLAWFGIRIDTRFPKLTKCHTFEHFIQTLARFSSDELKLNRLSQEVGVNVLTIKHWLQIAQKVGLIYYIAPLPSIRGKQIVKSPKVYFCDTGLLCYLLDIDSPEALEQHDHNEKIFKTYTMNAIRHTWHHYGENPPFYFLRDNRGVEVDLLIQRNAKFHPIMMRPLVGSAQKETRCFTKLLSFPIPLGLRIIITASTKPENIAKNTYVHSVWHI